MDKETELLKLQIAAQHYESTLQFSENYFVAFAVGVLILSISLTVSGWFVWYKGVLAWFVCLVVAAVVLYRRSKDYDRRMEKLDGYLQNLGKAQVVPSLKSLIEE
jgi:4-hydroxybenzoate polyprenyltransferase